MGSHGFPWVPIGSHGFPVSDSIRKNRTRDKCVGFCQFKMAAIAPCLLCHSVGPAPGPPRIVAVAACGLIRTAEVCLLPVYYYIKSRIVRHYSLYFIHGCCETSPLIARPMACPKVLNLPLASLTKEMPLVEPITQNGHGSPTQQSTIGPSHHQKVIDSLRIFKYKIDSK